MSDLLIAPAYAEIAALKRHFQLLNGSPEILEFLMSPGVTGAGLQTLLATPANLTAFQRLVSSPAGAAAVLNSAGARRAVYDSGTAWNSFVSNVTAKTLLLDISMEHSTKSGSHVRPTDISSGVRAVLVQQKTSGAYISHAGANADTYSTESSYYIDRYVRVTGLAHRISTSGSIQSFIKYVIMQ